MTRRIGKAAPKWALHSKHRQSPTSSSCSGSPKMDAPSDSNTHLTWFNVGLGFAFVIADGLLSVTLGLGIGSSLLTAALRCILQLSVMALILEKIFEADHPAAVFGMTVLLNILGTFETVVNKSKMRFSHMAPAVFLAMTCSTIPVSIIGTRFAMAESPFWKPEKYIPVLGMLCGNTISSIVVALSSVLRELHDNRDKVEMYLAFGASRFEACKPIATEALRLALTPTINQMSVIGLISLPGMLTGALLGGSSVEQAAKLQMVIMFMISASAALSSMVAIVLTLSIVVDGDHRVRGDRIVTEKHAIWLAKDAALGRASTAGESVLDALGLRKRRPSGT